MGVTEPWMVTTEGQKNWTAACEREIEARFNWNDKWGWMPVVMAETIDKLKTLKEKQIGRILEKEASSKKELAKNPRPLPNSVNHEYGWLVSRPDYQIERFGPFPLTMKVRVEPTLDEIDEEVEAQDLLRARRALEKKKLATLERKMAEEAAQDRKRTEGNGPSLMSMMGSQPQASELKSKADHEKAEAAEATDVPKEIIDPGHIKSEGRKKRYCCCTANCHCKTMKPIFQRKL
uniref:Sensor protein lytS n=1 Tax=Lygus hesperus TaxID=30085 RepID=A0A0A9ZAX5_LYGHE